MCVMYLHYISDEKPKLPGIKLLHFSFKKFALLNSLEHEVSLLYFI